MLLAVGGDPIVPTDDAARREELRAEIVTLLQNLTTESNHVAQAFAAQQGLSHTDLEALLHVMQAEARGAPTTSGAIADTLGLTSGAATGVIDRLVRSGHAERRRDERDRRVIHVHYSPAARAVAQSFFRPLRQVTDGVMIDYTVDELAVITRFLGTMTSAMEEHARAVANDETAVGRTVEP